MLEIRPMTEENYEEAARIEAECFADRPWTAKQFAEELSLDFSRTFIAYCDGTAVGFANVWLTPPDAVVNNIAVRDGFRRMGAASALLKAVFEECGDCGGVTLEVRASNQAAIALYEKHGFSVAGMRKGFYENPREDAYIMKKFMKRENADV